jgi:FkbH-like protein
MRFSDLKKNLGKDFSSFPSRRIAILGDSATQFLAKAIKGYGYEEKYNFEVFDADFDQLDQQILDSKSELYRSNPQYVVLFLASEKLLETFASVQLHERKNFATDVLSKIENWWKVFSNISKAKIIHLNFIELDDGIFGHFAAKTPSSFLYQIKKLNIGLMSLAQNHGNIFLTDIAGLSSRMGYANAHDPRLYATSKVTFSLDFLPFVAKAIVDVLKAIEGNIKKCLILDLDNTCWGGVIGDDGMENIQIGDLGMGHAFDELQRWAKELKRRGIVLAICSKNDETIAKQPFQEHPDMTLRLDDIAVFVANWENKVDNIRRIQETLNIGFDSLVFLDDNPFERNLIRELLPQVAVPELPEDPALYVSYLRSLNLFETASFSEEDLQRTRQYQEEIARGELQKSFTSIDDYLKGLEMVSVIRPFDEFSVPRVAQLTQRSNQFNLRTIRYSEADVKELSKAKDVITLSFNLKDKFGDHGLIGLVIMRRISETKAFIDTWIMSCRVLKRGMEEFIVNQFAERALAAGIETVVGEYVPTAKNGMVKDLYSQMGFKARDGKWELSLRQRAALKTYICAN